MIPPPLWKSWDFVLQLSFTIAQVFGEMITAADFLSRLDWDTYGMIVLKIREDIATKPSQVYLESTGIAQKETFFFDTTDQHETTEKELWKSKKRTRNAIPSDRPVIKTLWYYANGLQKDTTIVNVAQ